MPYSKSIERFFGINTISASEEITFTCLVFPVFESKELMLESLTPGQYTQLSSAVLTLNGFEEGNTGENKTN